MFLNTIKCWLGSNSQQAAPAQRTRLAAESLEGRDLMAVTAGVLGSTLYISGTAGADNISVTQDSVVRVYSGNKEIFHRAASQIDKIQISALAGNDVIDLTKNASKRVTIKAYVDAGDGNDTVRVGDGSSSADGGRGNDTLQGGKGNDKLDGGDGNDAIYGGTGDDELIGLAGNDYLDGQAGHDKLRGGIGNDTLHGGDGNDFLDAGAGNDALYGESGDDTLVGRAGNDGLYGGIGDDLMIGGEGKDIYDGGASSDIRMYRKDVILGYEKGESVTGVKVKINDKAATALGFNLDGINIDGGAGVAFDVLTGSTGGAGAATAVTVAVGIYQAATLEGKAGSGGYVEVPVGPVALNTSGQPQEVKVTADQLAKAPLVILTANDTLALKSGEIGLVLG
jgi:hypothetical protein